MTLMFLCRRANKNPACLEKRARMSDILSRDSEEDSPPGSFLKYLHVIQKEKKILFTERNPNHILSGQ